MTFKVGDKVMITNAGGIMFGKKYFKDGDITEVVAVEEFIGEQGIDVKVAEDTARHDTAYINGVPTLYILGDDELQHVAKVLPDNREVT